MRRLPLIGALLLAATSLAPAQVAVSAQMQRSNFLLYERVMLYVTVSNIGGNDLVLGNNEGRPWLSFLVSKHGQSNDFPVPVERESNPAPLTLKVGESKTLGINITPLFSFREMGEYRASAVVDLPGEGQIISDAVPFSVYDGRMVWSQQRSVDGTEMTYSLVRFSPKLDSTQLYLRVQAPDENLVYANIALGEIVSSIDPEVYFDPTGNLHVLQPVAAGTYLYTRADPKGLIVHQTIFKSAPTPASGFDFVPPRLVKLNDGNVIVYGGLSEDGNAPRERLSVGQKSQPSAAPAPASTTPPSAPPQMESAGGEGAARPAPVAGQPSASATNLGP